MNLHEKFKSKLVFSARLRHKELGLFVGDTGLVVRAQHSLYAEVGYKGDTTKNILNSFKNALPPTNWIHKIKVEDYEVIYDLY